MNDTTRAALVRQLDATPSPAPRPAADVVDPAAHAFRARVVPRYIGSLTDVHGEVVAVHPCPLVCCDRVPEEDQPHARLVVAPDLGGPGLVTLDRARFESFTGRPQ